MARANKSAIGHSKSSRTQLISRSCPTISQQNGKRVQKCVWHSHLSES